MKTLTAIGSSEIDYSLFSKNGYELLSRDIIYQDGIFELLEIYKDIEVLFISDILIGEKSTDELIKKIVKKYDKIDIIVFLDDYNYDQINRINSCGVYKIYEIENYKEIFLEKQEINISTFKEELKNKIQLKQNNKQTCIVGVFGIGGVGKSIISCIIAKCFANQGNKVLLITNQESTQDLIIEYEKNRKKIFLGIEICLLLESKFKDINFEIEYFYNVLKKTQNKYDYVIVDMNDIASQKEKILYEFADQIIILLEANKLSIRKTMLYINKRDDVFKNKIKIIINKKSKYSIELKELEEIFFEYDVLGEIKYYEIFNEIINKNSSYTKIFDDINNIVKKIA